jgi:hypothetical protein
MMGQGTIRDGETASHEGMGRKQYCFSSMLGYRISRERSLARAREALETDGCIRSTRTLSVHVMITGFRSCQGGKYTTMHNQR